MLAQLLAFLGSLFNLAIDTIFKIGVSLMFLFLSVIAMATAFTVLLVWMLV